MEQKDTITWQDLRNNPNRMLTSKEVAYLLHITEDVLRDLRYNRKITFYRITRLNIQYKALDIIEYFESCKVTEATPHNPRPYIPKAPKKKDEETPAYTWDYLEKNPLVFLSTAEVKQIFYVSDPTLYRWRKEKVIKCYKIGGQYKYMAGDIIAYIKENKL